MIFFRVESFIEVKESMVILYLEPYCLCPQRKFAINNGFNHHLDVILVRLNVLIKNILKNQLYF